MADTAKKVEGNNDPVRPVNGASAGAINDSEAAGKPTKLNEIRRSVVKALRFFVYVAVPILIWNGLAYFELIPQKHSDAGMLILSVALFFLSMPCSFLFRMDSVMANFQFVSHRELSLLIALGFVLVNFVVLAVLRGVVHSFFGFEDRPKTPKRMSRRGM